MGLKSFFTQKRVGIKTVDGFIGKSKPAYVIFIEDEPGLVTIDKRKYYFLGATKTPLKELSVAKSLTGAAIGTVLAPGLGTLIGGAIGAKKKDKTTFTLSFMDVETNEKYFVEGTLLTTTTESDINKLQAHPIAQQI